MKTLAIAIVAAGLLAGATSASAAEREAVTLKVEAVGVNFADPASVASLRRQLDRKIEAACNPGDRLEADLKPDFRCRREMAAALEPTIYQLAQRDTQRNLATTD